jgi:diadenosine tetraphosphatase ApaH/serine/threonine PP2A family protein phosphatase
VIGLIYDVHGNLEALEAVLADAGEAGIGRFVLGGDYALFGPRPAETVERLRSLDARWIRGNVDRWTAHAHDAPDDPLVHEAIVDCSEDLGDRVVAELGVLPEFLVDEGRVRFSHASPISDVRSFGPEPSDEDEELLGGHREPLQVFGHTHVAFEREGPGGIRLVNPGSVGMPLDGDQRASWAILHDDGRIEHRRVAYDYEGVVAGLRVIGAAWADRSARRIELAQFIT